MADVEWNVWKCAERHGRKEGRGAGEGYARMILRTLLFHRHWLMALFGLSLLLGCRRQTIDPGTVVMIIESSPNNLDLRQGTDAQSERVGGQIFDALVKKDEHFNLRPWLATSWEQPDALTWVIHLRDGVRFQDKRPLEAEDVAWTIRSMIDGTLITAKSGAFASVDRVEVRDRLTLAVRLKYPDAGLLF